MSDDQFLWATSKNKILQLIYIVIIKSKDEINTKITEKNNIV